MRVWKKRPAQIYIEELCIHLQRWLAVMGRPCVSVLHAAVWKVVRGMWFWQVCVCVLVRAVCVCVRVCIGRVWCMVCVCLCSVCIVYVCM